jgi:hypothetical protein
VQSFQHGSDDQNLRLKKALDGSSDYAGESVQLVVKRDPPGEPLECELVAGQQRGVFKLVLPRLILDILSSGDSHHYRRGQRTPIRTGPNQATGSILPNGGLLTGRGVRSADQVPKYSWIWRMAIDPSPTADATRLTEPLRTSPAANTPGRLVSSIIG